MSSTRDNSEAAHTPRISWLTYISLVLLATLPLMGLGVVTYHLYQADSIEWVERNQHATAAIAAHLVEAEFDHWTASSRTFAQRPLLVGAMQQHDEDRTRELLQVLVERHPRIDRAFVTDTTGLLWSDYPRAPESLKKRFDDRDWFKGVSNGWQTYVSAVYRRHAEPRRLLVAVATPVMEPKSGEVLGVLVYQVTLDKVVAALNSIEVGEQGHAFLLDHTGTVAAHPRLDLQARIYTEYGQSAPFQAENGGKQRIRYDDPLFLEPMLASATPCKVGNHRWVVVSQEPEAASMVATDVLVRRVVLVAGLLGVLFGGAGVLLARGYIRERQRLFRESLERSQALASREEQIANLERLAAEGRISQQELLAAKKQLEQQVEQRTTELRTVEEQLMQSQKMEAIGQLAGGIAHDFNNLLSVIIGYGDLLLMRLKAGEPHRAEIEEIRNAGDRASQLTRQLLAFSRKQVLQPEVLNLNAVVAGMDKMLRRLIGEDIDLKTHLAPDLDHVKVDPGQIEQVIMNLAVNARDAMPQGGKITIQTDNVELSAEYAEGHIGASDGPHVLLAVTDTGIGMDAETRRRIFEPFFTTKEMGRGTGLGLSTVYGIAKQSGGNIWVYSEPGRGTTFKIYLPAVELPAQTRSTRTLPVSARGTETILLVEDDAMVRKLIEAILTGSGYKVITAHDPATALQFAASYDGKIHLLLTDVVMPGMGGPQLARELTAKRPETKVLYMSGYTDNAIVHHGVLDPGTAFLEKPARPQAVLAKVREVLDQTDTTA